MVDTLTILAPGLLGGSVAQAARARGAARRIVIWARRPEVRLALTEQPWCDDIADTPETAVAEASLVVIAAPVTRINELVDRIAPHLPATAIVTDVGSVKAEICRHACSQLAAHNPAATFIGSHPMAGSALTGWAHGDPELFAGRTCFVTPHNSPPEDRLTTVVRFWRDLGSDVVTIDPDQHDEIVAHISHLPQVVATALGETLAGQPTHWSQLAGNGLRDTTRIAASDATMWVDILEQNRDEVLRALDRFETDLHHFRAALANRDWPAIRAHLERGKAWRDTLHP
ncbi:prephenate dehydrogenase [Synoicihabitans lomoniglobus]|uniref:Prephenate dehydrogenase/arogenate dehydrogenase family protein n=1 Tax=Synoicihabitans lomoniglobus TaxID=2909285 RepID=A0AAE9ZZB8_9BACT|nr:prephenate dehydrogenase/arogenate dehydrogenase family protein [Opitutaceae bacterium LMO-M01]WED63292.1 prephenate dehydrogenase/arogenate dehydrogenase family protein [Opitutaceae bacterium LMO-M01]